MKQWLIDFLIRSDGAFNIRAANKAWWAKRNLENKYSELLKLTAFLPTTASIHERVVCVLSNITTLPICKVCKTPVKMHKKKYSTYCSTTCSANCPEKQQ